MDVLTPEQFLMKRFGESPEDIELPQKFEELKGSAEIISEEMKGKRAEELENMSGKELGKAFGLDQD